MYSILETKYIADMMNNKKKLQGTHIILKSARLRQNQIICKSNKYSSI